MLRNYGERFGPKPLRKCPFLRPGGRETPHLRENFVVFQPKIAKILEKSRAARAEEGQIGHRNRESAAGAGEIEDHAKITDSEVTLSAANGLRKRPRI